MISLASSIKFRKQDGLSSSFDNTYHNDFTRRGGWAHRYNQKFYATDTDIVIQAKVIGGYTVEFYYSQDGWKPWTAMASATLKTDGTDYDYYEQAVDFSYYSSYDCVQFKMLVLDGATVKETWISEPCEVVAEDSGLIKSEFYNIDNAFEVDYSTDIVHRIRVEGQLSEYKSAGESTVFDNQNEVTKIREEVKRMLSFKTDPIPWYLAEMLIVACAHDEFFINDVAFVAENKPEWEGNASNMGTLTMNLTQREVIGLNTHDIGYDCDSTTNSDTMVLQEIDLSGQKSFTVPDGYLIAHITGHRTAGDPVVIAGTTPGGTDVLLGMSLNNTDNKYETAIIGREIATSGDATLYVDVSGAGATASIYILLLKNRQA